MLYIVSGELIPESNKLYSGRMSAVGNMIGFIIGIFATQLWDNRGTPNLSHFLSFFAQICYMKFKKKRKDVWKNFENLLTFNT